MVSIYFLQSDINKKLEKNCVFLNAFKFPGVMSDAHMHAPWQAGTLDLHFYV